MRILLRNSSSPVALHAGNREVQKHYQILSGHEHREGEDKPTRNSKGTSWEIVLDVSQSVQGQLHKLQGYCDF